MTFHDALCFCHWAWFLVCARFFYLFLPTISLSPQSDSFTRFAIESLLSSPFGHLSYSKPPSLASLPLHSPRHNIACICSPRIPDKLVTDFVKHRLRHLVAVHCIPMSAHEAQFRNNSLTQTVYATSNHTQYSLFDTLPYLSILGKIHFLLSRCCCWLRSDSFQSDTFHAIRVSSYFLALCCCCALLLFGIFAVGYRVNRIHSICYEYCQLFVCVCTLWLSQ